MTPISKRKHRAAALVPMAMALVLSLPALPAEAHDYSVGDLHIDHPFARATTSRAMATAAYLTIENRGTSDDTLVAGSTPAAEVVELHSHIEDNGVMRMREVAGGIPIPADETVVLEPGGLHVMFMGLTAPPLEAGSMVPLTLTFEQAGDITVEVAVQSLVPASPGADGQSHGHDHGHDHGDGHSHGTTE